MRAWEDHTQINPSYPFVGQSSPAHVFRIFVAHFDSNLLQARQYRVYDTAIDSWQAYGSALKRFQQCATHRTYGRVWTMFVAIDAQLLHNDIKRDNFQRLLDRESTEYRGMAARPPGRVVDAFMPTATTVASIVGGGGAGAGIGRERDTCHLCGQVTDPPHIRTSCWMLASDPDPDDPNSGWVAGKTGVIAFAAIKATMAANRQPPACKECYKWGHTRRDCPN
jgi:hypothetical protein